MGQIGGKVEESCSVSSGVVMEWDGRVFGGANPQGARRLLSRDVAHQTILITAASRQSLGLVVSQKNGIFHHYVFSVCTSRCRCR